MFIFMRKFLLLLFISFAGFANAQFTQTHHQIIAKNTWYEWQFDFEFSSISFGVFHDQIFKNAQVIVNESPFNIKKDEHSENDSLSFANLIIPQKTAKFIKFYSGEIEGDLFIYLYFAPPLPLKFLPKKKANNCVLPDAVPQSLWRAGLPNPKGIRSTSEVRHLAVHHSAGSNTDTNYINVIRNIYLYHTNQNGWDDIAYNYLISQDGTLFLGRDSMGKGAHDDIIGAHFCAKNTGTMGICLLGNYEEVSLPDKMYSTLKQVLTWKCAKENLLPDDSEIHPKTGTEYLKHVVGHRDGCATECPGDSVYQLLSVMRKEIRNELYNCAPTTNVSKTENQILNIFPNPSNSEIFIQNYNEEQIEITNMLGQKFEVKRVQNLAYDVSQIPNGLYFLNVFSGFQKVIIQH